MHSTPNLPLLVSPDTYAATRARTRSRRHQPSTTHAYARDVGRLVSVCGPLPHSPEVLAKYIVQKVSKLALSTLLRRCAAVHDAHIRHGHRSPTEDPHIRAAIRLMSRGHAPSNLLSFLPRTASGMNSTHSTSPPVMSIKAAKPVKVATPISASLLQHMLAVARGETPQNQQDGHPKEPTRPQEIPLAALRDAAILLLGHYGLKRSSISALNIEDLVFTPEALLIREATSRSSNRTPSASNRTVAKGQLLSLPASHDSLCAVQAVQDWLKRSGRSQDSGPLFLRISRAGEPLHDHRLDSAYVNCIVKKRLQQAGVQDVSAYSAESLRKR